MSGNEWGEDLRSFVSYGDGVIVGDQQGISQ